MTSRLKLFQIDGLFGLYRHQIPLNLDDRITIIIGPNGRGKTVCLKMIESIFRKNFSIFSEVPFNWVEYVFTGGEKIRVEASDPSDEDRNLPGTRFLRVVLFDIEGERLEWIPSEIDQSLISDLRRYIPRQWKPAGQNIWVDETDGEEVSIEDLASRYRVPARLKEDLRRSVPEAIARLVDPIDCHLIETQRLLSTREYAADSGPDFSYYGRPRTQKVDLAIQEKAKSLQKILNDMTTTYGNLAQSLDRNFPLRVFEAQGTGTLTEDQLRAQLKELDERRAALMTSGILDQDYDAVTIKDGSIEPGVAMALEIYVQDNRRKLALFDELRDKVNLFKHLIDSRFLDKSLRIDRENGFKIMSSLETEVPLEKLSSGEQHQLILLFDLLFEVNKDALILIDEPELSLHIAWQKTFVESLARIISLNRFDVLLATHSPALLARNFNLAVTLGAVDLDQS